MRCSFGIDLASNCKDWGVCKIDWWEEPRPPRIVVHDEIRSLRDLLKLLGEAHDGPVGIDAPFGWPKGFKALVEDANGERLDDGVDGIPLDISYRITDLVVSALKSNTTGVAPVHDDWLSEQHGLTLDHKFRFIGSANPMSVVTSLLTGSGIWAQEILDGSPVLSEEHRWGVNGSDGDSNTFYEIYPAAVIAAFHEKVPKSGERMGFLSHQTDGTKLFEVDFGDDADASHLNRHQQDAVICAVIAQAAHHGLTLDPIEVFRNSPDDGQLQTIREEGWIHLPKTEPRAADTWPEFVQRIRTEADAP